MATEVPTAQPLSTVPDWALARVPGFREGQPARILRLGGGTVNEVCRVTTAAGDFVLRLDGAAWRRPGVDRERELLLHQIAAAGGVAPDIVAAAPQSQGLLITRYQPGRCWEAQDFADVAALRRLGERLYVLHRLPAPDIPPFDPVRVGRAYAQLITRESADLAAVMRRLEVLCQSLKQTDAAPAVVHGDLWQGNVLEGEGLWLLDWEYAQLSDPLMDVACLLAYYPQADTHRADLLAAAGFAASDQARRLTERIDIYRILSWLWHLARGEAADPP